MHCFGIVCIFCTYGSLLAQEEETIDDKRQILTSIYMRLEKG